MNPDTQIILDEIVRRFSENDTKWDRCMAEQDTHWETTFKEFAADQKAWVQVLEKASGVFDDWCMSLEGRVEDLRLEVRKLSKNWERRHRQIFSDDGRAGSFTSGYRALICRTDRCIGPRALR